MSKKKKESTINTGVSIYQLNKKGMDLYKPMPKEEIVSKLFEYLVDFCKVSYLMLLNNERKDYTIFKLNHLDQDLLTQEVTETLLNRGEVIDITLTENKDAVEIWIRDNKENYCYYLFDYSAAIVEV